MHSFWGGLFASLGACLVAWLWIVLLFGWDEEKSTRSSRDADILRGLFDDRTRD